MDILRNQINEPNGTWIPIVIRMSFHDVGPCVVTCAHAYKKQGACHNR